MSLVSEYKRQFGWRDWKSALDLCPIQAGQKVLDLGCGPGDLARELVRRGAVVTGIDGNAEFIALAKLACPETCSFVECDLATIELPLAEYDGLWCSFTSAYFPNFEKILRFWLPALKESAWICVTEIDDLLGHEPLPPDLREGVQEFYQQAFRAGRYDFLMGRKLESVLRKIGFQTSTCFLSDKELSFSGAASDEVLQAWSDRLGRMTGLNRYFGERFAYFRKEFLQALASEEHEALCKVVCCVGTRRS
jgi:ubiquinone/menaquinone biosynthesis C-methylase UbiE